MKNILHNVGLLINKPFTPKGHEYQETTQRNLEDFKINLISCIDDIMS